MSLRWQNVALGALGLAALDMLISRPSNTVAAGGLLSALAALPNRLIDPTVTLTAATTSSGTSSGTTTDSYTPGYTPSAASSASAAGVVGVAEQWVAAQVPYKWGGTSMAGADCSGFVQTDFATAGISLPRTTYQQVQAGTAVPVAGVGGTANAQPGDLVFFDGDSHVGIYAGGGQMFDEPHTGGHAELVPLYGTPDAIRDPFPAPAGLTFV